MPSRQRARSPFHREVEALERAIHNVRNAESIDQPLQFVNPGVSDEDIHAVMRVLRSGSHLFVVALPEGTERECVQRELREAGVPSAVHFPPLHHFDWFRAHAEIGRGGLSVADAYAERVLSLPLHAEMSVGDVERVVTTLRGAIPGVSASA